MRQGELKESLQIQSALSNRLIAAHLHVVVSLRWDVGEGLVGESLGGVEAFEEVADPTDDSLCARRCVIVK